MVKDYLKVGGLAFLLGGAAFTVSFGYYAGKQVANIVFDSNKVERVAYERDSNAANELAFQMPASFMPEALTEAQVSAKKKVIAENVAKSSENLDEVVKQTISHLPGAEQTMAALRDNRVSMEKMVGAETDVKARASRLEDLANTLLKNSAQGPAVESEKPVAKVVDQVVETGEEKPMTLSLGKDINGNDLGVQGRVMQLKALAEKLNDDFTVNFPAKGVEKDELFVFTDPTCPYCQKLHKDIPKLQEQGYTVRYFYFPRNGVGPSALKSKMEATWCSPNQAGAVDEMFAGLPVASNDCSSLTEEQKAYGNIVEQHFVLAKILNVEYTPTVFTSKGIMTEGYANIDKFKFKLGLQ